MTTSESAKAVDAELRQLIADNPLTALSLIADLRSEVAKREREAVFRALEEHTWREVGEALGVSKQAVFQRFGPDWIRSTKSVSPKEWKRTVKQRLTE